MGAGLLVAAVIATYAYSRFHGTVPPGHPWSSLTMVLLAVQWFLPLKPKQISSFILPLFGLAAAGAWFLSARSAQQAHAGSKETNEPPSSEGAGGLTGTEPAAPGQRSDVYVAAASALREAAALASYCHRQGEPVGSGKVRVVYAQDGTVQSPEVLTKELRETVTGSCVRLAFQGAKIPAFSGPLPTYIKEFSIPEE